jgi:hypothetical protein
MMKKSNSKDQIAERIIQLMQRDDSADAPGDSIRWAKNIFRSRVSEPKASLVQKVLAVLQMDISPNKAAFGERSGTGGQARQMLFDAGENSIDLRIKETDGAWEIHGQILGTGFAGGTVKLFNNNTSHKASASEMSEFKLAGVAPGVYSFAVTSGEKELVIEGLDLS